MTKTVVIRNIAGKCALLALAGCAFASFWQPAQAQQMSENDAINTEVKALPLVYPMFPVARVTEIIEPLIPQLYSFNYENYEQRITAVQPYFTEDGWRSYFEPLRDSLQAMIDNDLASQGKLDGPLVVRMQGPTPDKRTNDPRFVWVMTAPFKLAYGNEEQVNISDFTLRVTAARVPFVKNPRGFMIDKLELIPVPKAQAAEPVAEDAP